MEAEQVVEKILNDAKAQAEQIKEQADEKLAAEQAKADAELSAYRRQTDTIAKEAAEAEKSHILAAARMEIAKEYLVEKIAILAEIFEKAKAKLTQLPDDQYRKLMTKLMLAVVETGDEEVVVDKNETRIDNEFIKTVNRELGPGYQGNLRLARDKQNLDGGFIFRRGKIKTNVSIGVLLQQARKDLEIELAQSLFED